MYTNEEIRRKFAMYASKIDEYEKWAEKMFVRKRRKQLLRKAYGNVLDVAVGTGKNLLHYPDGCDIIGLDYSPEMLVEAKKKARQIRNSVKLVEGDAGDLPFDDNRFDTVVSTLSLCTFPEPVQALTEMQRVCKPEGQILLFEHGKSRWPFLGSFQDKTAERHARVVGCHWNRKPLELVRLAEMHVVSQRSWFGDFFVEIVAKPRARQTNRSGLNQK